VLRRADGTLEYRARVDRQIKLRGHRIEPEEIETRLRADDTVGEAVVERDGDTLIGFMTPAHPGQALPLDHIRNSLATWLPAVAVPARLVELAQFPVTAAGKVDRHRLRRLVATETTATPAPADGPGPGLQDTVAQVWQLVLGVHPAPGDSFFAIGGDSLLAAEAVTRTLTAFDLDARHGRTLVHNLLRSPALEDFTAAVATIRDRPGKASADTGPVDFRAEARLGFTLPAQRGPDPDWRHPGEVLLTGVSGFVGAFLLAALLRRTDARVHCPVRSRDRAHARQKVARSLARFDLATAEAADRIVCSPPTSPSPASVWNRAAPTSSPTPSTW
jgi:hypothetical protein